MARNWKLLLGAPAATAVIALAASYFIKNLQPADSPITFEQAARDTVTNRVVLAKDPKGQAAHYFTVFDKAKNELGGVGIGTVEITPATKDDPAAEVCVVYVPIPLDVAQAYDKANPAPVDPSLRASFEADQKQRQTDQTALKDFMKTKPPHTRLCVRGVAAG